ncbi:hypothetical protein Bbelb_347900 [Branchiostoma belcheri]|nr:hypothetical protein Bbelb_399220 [Branchiostoma belcheri]KAI8487556.1 hypothetical protein Bbelb_347900 [Branchiostoma belcheri]
MFLTQGEELLLQFYSVTRNSAGSGEYAHDCHEESHRVEAAHRLGARAVRGRAMRASEPSFRQTLQQTAHVKTKRTPRSLIKKYLGRRKRSDSFSFPKSRRIDWNNTTPTDPIDFSPKIHRKEVDWLATCSCAHISSFNC